MSKGKDLLKRIVLIVLIMVTCASLLTNVILIWEVNRFYIFERNRNQVDITQMTLLYSSESRSGHVVKIYQTQAQHELGNEHVYGLAFVVDGEFHFVCDITYFTEYKHRLESTSPYLGDLPKEDIIGIFPKNQDSYEFWIGIYSYSKSFRDDYTYNIDDRNKQYVFSYTFDNDGPKLWTNLKEEDITIINENLTVTFAE